MTNKTYTLAHSVGASSQPAPSPCGGWKGWGKRTLGLFLLLTCSSAWAATNTLIPTADAYVQAGTKNAAKNFGTLTTLNIGTSDTLASNYDSYLKFDTASLPNITSAKLRIYAALSRAGSVVSTTYPVAVTSWGETTITWNTKPAYGTALGTLTVASTTYAWYEVDVTSYVQSEFAAGRKVISFAWHNSASTRPYLTAYSKEGVNKPQLLITYNIAPTVSITSPVANSVFNAPVNVTLTATAADSDGTISKIEFYDNGTLLGTAVANSYDWNNAPAGIHQITAKATDNLNLTTTSSPVSITVLPAPALYYIETDHLDTPRQLTDSSSKVVWQWNGTDAFGANLPNEDADGDGIKVTFNLRMPGQYADKETGTFYNYFRDYDSSIGRHTTFDPIGLRGGINGFIYVGGNPVSYIDPFGLFEITVNDPGGRNGATYGGTITVTGNNGQTVTVPASSWPNPSNPSPGIQPGSYTGMYSPTGHQGTTNGVRVNNGGGVPTMGPNPAQGGQSNATGINIHCGYSATNRGSAGCVTVSPSSCQQIWNVLQPGETGTIQVNR